MTPTQFKGMNVVFAENQEEFLPLPAHVHIGDPQGAVTTCWEVSEEEILQLIETRKLYLTVLTFKNPLQPQLPSIDPPLVLLIQDDAVKTTRELEP